MLSNRVKHKAESSAVSMEEISCWILLKIFYSHIRNDLGFHSKYFMVTSEMIWDSTQNILWSCQKWFWIPLQIFYSHVRNDFGFHSKYFWVMSEMIFVVFSGIQNNFCHLLSAKQVFWQNWLKMAQNCLKKFFFLFFFFFCEPSTCLENCIILCKS